MSDKRSRDRSYLEENFFVSQKSLRYLLFGLRPVNRARHRIQKEFPNPDSVDRNMVLESVEVSFGEISKENNSDISL